MRDLDRALAEIGEIRSRMAADMPFRGLGPAAVAATGGLAIVVAAAQSLFLPTPDREPLLFLAGWALAAAVAIGLIGLEMRRRARRHHHRLADAMIRQAFDGFMPAGAAGIALPLVLFAVAPDSLWMMPGLWQLLVGIGIFAASRTLPRGTALAGAWYVAAGLAMVGLAGAMGAASPWMMGLPFAIGQAILASVLLRAPRNGDDDEI